MSEALEREGPLVWFECQNAEDGAVLECAADGCGYVVATGSLNDQTHTRTPLMREGLA